MRTGPATAVVLALASPATAQDLRDVTLTASSRVVCNNAPEAARQIGSCDGVSRIYFAGGKKAYYHWTGSDSSGLVFEIGRTITTKAPYAYNGVIQTISVRTTARFDGRTLTVGYVLDHAGHWPDDRALRHRQNSTERIALDGSGGCKLVDFRFGKHMTMGTEVLENWRIDGLQGQSCSLTKGRL